jgi:hypothetical protein
MPLNTMLTALNLWIGFPAKRELYFMYGVHTDGFNGANLNSCYYWSSTEDVSDILRVQVLPCLRCQPFLKTSSVTIF